MFRFMVFILMVCAFQGKAKKQTMSLQKAIDLKFIATKVFSLGKYQGFCIKMGLKNMTKDSLTILIEAGRRLNSLDDKNQDILLVQEQFVALKNAEEKYVDVKGYCCQAANRCPPKDAKYDVNKLADSNLVRVARYLNACKYDAGIEQSAIWAVSDNKSVANIASANDTTFLPLRQIVANLKGEVLPWYTIISNNHLYASGAIEVFPLLLKGKMKYSNQKEDYGTLCVTNEKGVLVGMVKSQWLKALDNQEYDLRLPIKGFEKGKYVVELKTAERQLAKKEFEL